MPNVILYGFFRCACGKMHSYSCLSDSSLCACERRLFRQAIDIRIYVPNLSGKAKESTHVKLDK